MRVIKYFVVAIVLLAAVLLAPVEHIALADEIDRTDSIPWVNDSSVEFTKQTKFDVLDFKVNKFMKEFVFKHRRLKALDYSLYDLVCDFELKAQNNDGTITTSYYSYTMDLTQYETGFFDNILIGLKLKDDYFEHTFNYRDIVKNAEGFIEYDESVLGLELYKYNTVISQADFYFVRKSDGERGQARRFTFVWDSDFYKQECTKITFSWYDFERETEKEIDSVEDESGVDGYNAENAGWWSDTVSLISKFGEFLVDVPKMLYILVTNIPLVMAKFLELLKAVFPFLPGSLFDVFGVVVVFAFLIALWKIIKGD